MKTCLLLAGAAVLALAPSRLAAAVGRWTPIGPYGGKVTALAVDPVNPEIIYAGGAGVWKSRDGGATWAEIDEGLPLGILTVALAIDPRDSSTIYLGVDNRGVYKSVDGGASWTPPGVGLEDARQMVFSLAIDPRHSGTVYAGTQPGVDKTVDGGATWAPAQHGIPGGSSIRSLAIDPVHPRTLYAAGLNFVFKTVDGGLSWLPLLGSSGSALAIDPSSPRTIYFGGAGVFKSVDGGATWKPARRGLGRRGVTALAVVPRHPRIVYAATSSGVFKSTDGAGSWVRADQGLQDTQVLALAVDPTTPHTLYAGTASQAALGGVFQSVDGGASWSARLAGLGGLPINAFTVDRVAPATIYASTSLGLFVTIDGGSAWSTAPGLIGGLLSVVQDPSAPATLYALDASCGGPPGPGLCRSLDAGATWGPIAIPTPFLTALAIDPRSSRNLYLVDFLSAGLFRSTDGGATWAAAVGDIAQVDLSGVVADPGLPGTLYAFGEIPEGLHGPALPRLLKSTDGGVTWTQIQGGIPGVGAGNGVGGLVVDAATDALYAESGNQIVKSADGGTSWSLIYTSPSGHFLLSAPALAPTNPPAIYVSEDDGLLASADGGATWQLLTSAGLTSRLVQIAVDPQDPRHLLGLDGGIVSLTLP
jgi:photosystem II stability/assembly factor-like uncharacterized protein